MRDDKCLRTGLLCNFSFEVDSLGSSWSKTIVRLGVFCYGLVFRSSTSSSSSIARLPLKSMQRRDESPMTLSMHRRRTSLTQDEVARATDWRSEGGET